MVFSSARNLNSQLAELIAQFKSVQIVSGLAQQLRSETRAPGFHSSSEERDWAGEGPLPLLNKDLKV